MECVICKNGNTKPGVVNVTLQRDDFAIIFKKVPADVCENCGEYYLDEDISDQLLKKAEDSIKKGAEVEILTGSRCLAPNLQILLKQIQELWYGQLSLLYYM